MEGGVLKSSRSIIDFFVIVFYSLGFKEILDLKHPCHNIILWGSFERRDFYRDLGVSIVVLGRHKSSHSMLEGSHKGSKLFSIHFARKMAGFLLRCMCVGCVCHSVHCYQVVRVLDNVFII